MANTLRGSFETEELNVREDGSTDLRYLAGLDNYFLDLQKNLFEVQMDKKFVGNEVRSAQLRISARKYSMTLITVMSEGKFSLIVMGFEPD